MSGVVERLAGGAKGFGYGKVEGRGDLDVFAVTFDEGDGMAEGFDHGGVVGEGVAIGLLVGAAQEVETEDLWRLHEAQQRAVEGRRGWGIELAHGLDDGYDGDGGSVLAGGFVATTNNINGDEGTHAVVNGNERIRPRC